MTNSNSKQSSLKIAELLKQNCYAEILANYLDLAKDSQTSTEIMRMLAQAAFCMDNFLLSKELLLDLIKKKPEDPAAWHDAALCLLKLKEFNSAHSAIQECLKLRPAYPASLLLLGNILKAQQKFTAAIDVFSEILSIDSDNIAALNNLATTLVKTGRYDEAEPLYQILLNSGEQSANNEFNYANLLNLCGKVDEAITHYQRAIKLDPDFFPAWNNIGQTFSSIGKLAEAEIHFNKALEIKPNSEEVKLNKGKLLHLRGEWEKATAIFEELSNASSEVSVSAMTNLCYVLNSSDEISAQELFKQHQKLYQRLYNKNSAAIFHPAGKSKLKIAYLSPDFRTHSVAYFFEGILKSHSKDRFHVTLYANQTQNDQTTKRLQMLADAWHWVKHLSDQELLDKIRSDNIEILIDLAGLTAGSRPEVMAQRAAPIQINYLGYPNTSGIPNMDYRVIDSITDPLQTNELATEKLIRLDPCFLCYQDHSLDLNKIFITSKDSFTFGCFNSIAKLSKTLIRMWSSILNSVPESKLILKSQGLGDETIRARINEDFSNYGIPSSRVRFFDFISSQKAHLELYNQIDLAFDSFPYCGTTTSCEALSMGVPVLTLCGDRHASRVGASLLSAIGLNSLITHSENEYVQKAISLAHSPSELSSMQELLSRDFLNSTLCDQTSFTKRWEEMLLAF